jgi:drug/metabolite transporter (DMT)-like permease
MRAESFTMTEAILPEQSSAAEKRRLRAHASLLVMAIIWAVNFPFAKVALREFSPLAFNALRFPLAAGALLVILRARGPLALPERRDVGRIVLLGALGNLLYQQFFIFGLDQTRAGNAALLLASTPLITALLSAKVGHERVNQRVWLGVSCTLIGISLVVFFGHSETGPNASLLGPLLLLGASISWAVYTVGSRSLVDRYGALPVTAWTLWVGSTLLLLVGLPDVLSLDFAAISGRSWLAVLYAGVLSVGIAYALWYNGVRELGNTRTATYSNLVPAMTLAVAWVWLGEVPTLGQILGAGVIIGGVTLAQSR